MSRRRWLPVIVALTSLPAFPAQAQLPSDLNSLRQTHDMQAQWAESLATSRHDAALRLLAIAEEIVALSDRPGPRRTELLTEARDVLDLIASLDGQIADATAMVRETRARLTSALDARADSLCRAAAAAPPSERRALAARARELEREVEALRAAEGATDAEDPLDSAAGTLSALARVVREEHGRLVTLRALQEELRLFLGDLRLFDETSMPPSARSGGEGGQDPGCQPSACPIVGSSPGDVPVAHFQPEGPGEGGGVTAATPASLARLHEQIAARAEVRERVAAGPAEEDMLVRREITTGAGIVAFRGNGGGSSALGPRAGASWVLSWPLGGSIGLTVEPAVGGRALRGGSSVATELAGAVRETLTGSALGGRSRWQVVSWQKGRYLSEPLPSPAYLEPGRVEAGLAGRVTLPLENRWELEAEGGAEGVRYESDDWKVLDRRGLNAALGVAWRGTSRAARLSIRGSHHRFPHPRPEWGGRRADTRMGVEVDGSLEGRWVARVSVGGSWNQSRLPAYDFRSGRAALVLSVPLGEGSLQGYAALAHQAYLNPGPEGARVAPSEHDSGSIVSLQYGRPLDARHGLILRGGWSRSQTGFRDDFYDRFGIGVRLTFRGG